MEKVTRENPEFKEIRPELIERVEGSDFTYDDKANLLLVAAGLKPASDIRLISVQEPEEGLSVELTEEEISSNLAVVKDSGVFFKAGEPKLTGGLWGGKRPTTEKEIEILIGGTQQDLDNLVYAYETSDSELLGRAYGFPATATEAYLGKRPRLDVDALPKKIKHGEAMAFGGFIFSADNWEEEIKQAQVWADFIKKVSPSIYKEALRVQKIAKTI